MCCIVTSDYLRVMQIQLQRGRFLTNRDSLASPAVVVIDDVVTGQVFPGLARWAGRSA
jgi:hypothetical protein